MTKFPKLPMQPLLHSRFQKTQQFDSDRDGIADLTFQFVCKNGFWEEKWNSDSEGLLHIKHLLYMMHDFQNLRNFCSCMKLNDAHLMIYELLLP